MLFNWSLKASIWLIQSEAIIIGNMPSPATRWGIFIILSTTAPSFLPISTSSIWSVTLLIPFIHNHPRSITPFSINPLVWWCQRKQSLLPCKYCKYHFYITTTQSWPIANGIAKEITHEITMKLQVFRSQEDTPTIKTWDFCFTIRFQSHQIQKGFGKENCPSN